MKQTILITGASTGIGKAAALHYAGLGHTVYAAVRKEKDAEALTKEASKIKPIFLDVTNQAQITKAAKDITKEQPKGPFCLVNNAGIAISSPLEALPLEKLRYQFEVNVFGVFAVTQAFLPLIRESQGRVVNMSSVAGRFASPFLGAYAASKFALEGMTDALRREVSKFGVRVVLIEPGPIDTPIWAKGAEIKDETFSKADPAIQQIYAKSFEKFEKYIAKSVEHADPVEAVIAKLDRALLAKNPRTRYTVGSTARMGAIVSHFPDTLVDQLVSRVRV